MWGKLGGKSLLVEVLKSDGCGLNGGNPTNLFRSVCTRRCQYVYFQNSRVWTAEICSHLMMNAILFRHNNPPFFLSASVR